MQVGIAADHGGFELKAELMASLQAAGYELVDFGAHRLDPADDYPDYVIPLARAVAAGTVERGIALCWEEADALQSPFTSTAAHGYLRLRRLAYGDAELRAWVRRIQAQPWKDAFVFFKHEDEATGPAFAARFRALWDATG